MLLQGAMERHIFKGCCPARERNRDRGHSKHVLAVQGAPREYERRHRHGNGSSRGVSSFLPALWSCCYGKKLRAMGPGGGAGGPGNVTSSTFVLK